ncbi:MAG: hypothetical protein K8T91_25285 [Planctomycetes bacterium]|nr:hypothetical protein [Planctomycetota bacterium]
MSSRIAAGRSAPAADMLAALDGVFFSLNKQAFVNYYYFVIAALWLAVATDDVSPNRGRQL